jgi:hypothetical protein
MSPKKKKVKTDRSVEQRKVIHPIYEGGKTRYNCVDRSGGRPHTITQERHDG